ncbi:hypothetical protein OUZ56_002928 [Daphnia magna]|uniref:Uncharacterized protein n=1 Tax=Daphnia magna TaxID=35525 RepID=A0ABR0A7P1_9CRUS|nr:hypothetical protein OUZ56_002928 [Daphnia magna]
MAQVILRYDLSQALWSNHLNSVLRFCPSNSVRVCPDRFNDFRFVALCQIKNCFTPCFVILFPDLSSQVLALIWCVKHNGEMENRDSTLTTGIPSQLQQGISCKSGPCLRFSLS